MAINNTLPVNNTVPNIYASFVRPKTAFPSNSTVPNIYKSLTAPQSALTSKISGTPPIGSRSVGTIGATGGYDTAPTIKPIVSAQPHIQTSVPTTGLIKPPVSTLASAQLYPPGSNGNAGPVSDNTQPTSQSGLIPTPQPQNQAPTYPGIVSDLVNLGTNGSQGYNKAVNNLADFDRQLAQKYGDIESTPIPLEFQQGREQVIARQAASERAALQGAVTQQQTQQGQQIGALGTAGGFAQPQLAGFNQQSFNPLTGTFGNTAGGTSALSQLPPQAQTAIQSYAQQVQSGAMTRADAESRLSAYGVAGTNALNEVLGTGFNTNASNASANTTQQGQQLQTAATATNQALATLQQLYNSLPSGTTTSIPGINGVGNSIANLLGSSALTTYKQTLADARAQLQGVLTASGAATPTGAESAALTYLPDNMSPDQLKQAISNVQQLIQQKVNSFTQSGQQNNQSQNGQSNSTSLYTF